MVKHPANLELKVGTAAIMGIFGIAMPSWSSWILVMNLLILLLGILVSLYWYRRIEDEQSYEALTGSLMLMQLAIFMVEPLLRIFFGTMVFWVLSLAFLLLILRLAMNNKVISRILHLSRKPRFLLRFLSILIPLLILSEFFVRTDNGLVISEIGAFEPVFVFSHLFYVIGFLFAWLAFVNLAGYRIPSKAAKRKKN